MLEDQFSKNPERSNTAFTDNKRKISFSKSKTNEGRASFIGVNNRKKSRLQKLQRKISEVMEFSPGDNSQSELQQIETCNICQCYLPPRAHHCDKCNKCILRMDHHNIFLRVCIGYRNYKYFILLLYYLLWFLFLLILDVIYKHPTLFSHYKIISILFLIISLPEFFVVLVYCIVHTKRMIKNEVTLKNGTSNGKVYFH